MTDILALQTENTEMATITTNKKTYYTSNFTAFVRTEKNLRGSVERPDLLDLIKNDGGVRDLCFVLPTKYNVEGKRVIWEGNSRHWCLEQLANDPGYEGSLDLPFLIIPESAAESETELIKFMLSTNSTDKRISPQEQWNGIKKLLNIYELEYQDSRDPRGEATKRVASELGKHFSWLQVLRRVYETASNPKIVDMLNEGIINGVDAADNLRVAAKKANMPIEEFVNEVLDHVHQAGKSKVTDTYIDQALKTLTVDVEDLLKETETNEDIEEDEDTEDALVEIENREAAIDKINFFVDFIKLLTSEDWKKISDKQILSAAKKIDSISMGFDKSLKKVKDAKNVEVIPVSEDVDEINKGTLGF
jgi:hypothetical protein